MSHVSDIVRQIAELSAPEREDLLHQLAGNGLPTADHPVTIETPAIVKTPDVCGGAARIIRTRIPVWTLQRLRQLGMSEAEILRSYPTLRAVDLVQAWIYADGHPDEIEQQIRENEEE